MSKHLTFSLPLPDNILRLMDPQERRKLGKDARLMEEINQDTWHRSERELHAQVRNLLNLKGIVYSENRMDKRSGTTVGWPDFTFAVLLNKPNKVDPLNVTMIPVPIGWEMKVGNNKLRPEQEEMLRRMQAPPNAWRVKIIRSLQEAADELKSLGV
jgi:hypothetical protein